MATRHSVLITGANGFIGSRLCKTFYEQGFRVIAAVRKGCNVRLLGDLPVEFRFGDVAEAATVPDLSEVDFIVHNAGVVKAKTREEFFRVNGQGTANLMAAVAQQNPQAVKVVYISSQAVAGPSIDGQPVRESDQPRPVTTYGKSKQAGEEAVLAYKDSINVAIARPSAVYGPGDKEVLTFFQVTNMHLKPLFGDTSRKLQLVHVDDLCRGIYLATVTPTRSGSIYHLAENHAYTLAEVIEMMQQAAGKWAMPLRIPSGLFRSVAAVSELGSKLFGVIPMLTREKCNELLGSWELATDRAKQELGFESKIPFEQGARETFAWYREHDWL